MFIVCIYILEIVYTDKYTLNILYFLGGKILFSFKD